jgi:hypothetical protein
MSWAILFVWMWQLLWEALSTLFGVLSRQGASRFDLQCDAALAISRINSAELLIGFCWPLLKRQIVALLLISIAMITGTALSSTQNLSPWLVPGSANAILVNIVEGLPREGNLASWMQTLSRLIPAWLQVLILSPLYLGAMLLSGALGSLCLMFTALGAGRRLGHNLNRGILPTLTIVAFALLVLIGYSDANSSQWTYLEFSGDPRRYPQSQMAGTSLVVWLLGHGTLCLAAAMFVLSKARSAALWWAYTPTVLIMFLVIKQILFIVISITSPMITNQYFQLLWTAEDLIQIACILSPFNPNAFPHPACLGTGFWHLITDPKWHHFRWWIALPFQLLLTGVLLRSALSSIALARRAEH